MLEAEYKVVEFSEGASQAWDDFVCNAKNGTFMLTRKFINYHGERFDDSSLMIYKNDRLIAVLPANIKDDIAYSHQGLSYAGLVLKQLIKLQDALSAFYVVLKYFDEKGIKELIVKQIPSLYQLTPSDEMNYAFFVTKSELYRRDAAICLKPSMYRPNENRKRRIKLAKSHRFDIRETNDMAPFWNDVLIPNLQISHDGKPVHSLDEIQFLKDSFPENIMQYDIYEGNKIVGGTTLFTTKKTSLAQYISATPYGKSKDALSYLFSHIITEKSNDFEYFSFGHSNEDNGHVLNQTLSYWKESFGGSTLTHDFYKTKVFHYHLIEKLIR